LIIRLLIIIVGLSLLGSPGYSTHILAGNITGEVVSQNPLTILFKVYLYGNASSTVQIGGGWLNFGDGDGVLLKEGADSIHVSNLVGFILEYIFYISHTYPPGTNFINVSYLEANRNGGILNMANSVNTTFYIESTFTILPDGNLNNTPVFLVPAIDFSVVGQPFVHNVGAVDFDGDSISFELITPQRDKGIEVSAYSFPDSTWIDEFGTLTWELPTEVGQFAYAFKVLEWRKINGVWEQVGFVIRDFLVIVGDSDNRKPSFDLSGSICVEAGDTLQIDLNVMDPDGDRLIFEFYSEVNSEEYNFSTSPILIDTVDSPVQFKFRWYTNCHEVRPNKYKLYFRVVDDHEFVSLSDYSVWFVNVIGPAPKEFALIPNTPRLLDLSWAPYCEGADSLKVLRRVGSYPFDLEDCETGIPYFARFSTIVTLSSDTTSFEDNNLGLRLARGATYCYRLEGVWNNGAVSIPSEEICYTVPVEAPVVTNVSVTNTNIQSGEIFLKWTSSFDLDPNLINSGFNYKVQIRGSNGSQLAWIDTPERIVDTTLRVNGLNTEDEQYWFRIMLFDQDILLDSSSWASSVRLEAESEIQKIILSWNAEVPWSNNTFDYPHHYIFRDRMIPDRLDSLVLIDSVNVNYDDFHFVDSGQFDNGFIYGDYKYLLKALGSYGNPKIGSPLINLSQVLEVPAIDDTPPCAPDFRITNNSDEECLATIFSNNCENIQFVNDLKINSQCDEVDIELFRIYFQFQRGSDFLLAGESTNPEFSHLGISSFAGCYYVVAVDYSGNESETSDIRCRDNCLFFDLPNVFTPNGDGKNDVFTVISNGKKTICPNFIRSITIQIFNRQGKEIYSNLSQDREDIFNLWDARNNHGVKISAGVYYYQVDVSYESLTMLEETYVGWISVLY